MDPAHPDRPRHAAPGEAEGARHEQADAVTLGTLAWLGLMLSSVLIRATVAIEPFPYWAQDPTLLPTPTTSLGPAATLGLNALTILAGTIVLARSRSARLRWVGPLAAAGVVPVVIHSLVGGVSVTDAHIGFAWVAAVYAAAAVWATAHHPRARSLAIAVVLGSTAMLAAKGVLQVLVEHPATVASFKANRELFLAANGWSPGSPMALAFERRLLQSEATAWFGLANVLVTLAAFSGVAGVGLAFIAWRRRAGTVAILGSILLALSGLGLVIAGGSKGGYAATTLGLATLAFVASTAPHHAPRLAPHAARLARWLPASLAAATVAAITLRGLLGERIGELSLLFRSFYIQAAARMLADGNWPLGVGPDGFKDAYLLHKNPLSPEEVTSPHNILVDWAATLGLGGAAWAALWVAAVVALGVPLARAALAKRHNTRPITQPAMAVDLPDTRPDLRIAFLVLAAVTIAGAWVEAAAGTPDSSLARAFGLAAAILIAAAVLRVVSPSADLTIPESCGISIRAALAAAGIPLALLGLIDMAPIAVGSCSWYLVALAAVTPPSCSPQTGARAGRLITIAGGFAALLTLVVAGARIVPWERRLAAAAGDILPLASLRVRAIEHAVVASTPAGTPLARELDADARSLLGVGFDGRTDALLARIAGAMPAALERAWGNLNAARAAAPLHGPTAEAASRVAAQLAQAMGADRARAAAWMQRAVDAAQAATRSRRGRATAHLWLATVLENAEPLVPGSAARVAPTLRIAADLDPFNAHTAARLARTLAGTGEPTAANWAARALELNSNLRLDPLRRLPADAEAELRAIARGAAGDGAGGG